MSPTLRRTLASLTAWLVGAIVAVSVGVLALSAIGDSWASGTPRSLQANTSTQYGTAPDSPTASPNTSTATSPYTTRPQASTGATQRRGESWAVYGDGGTGDVVCSGSLAYLTSWSPNPGYVPEEIHRGPAPVVSVKFASPGSDSVLRVGCVQGVPTQVGSGWSGDEASSNGNSGD